LHQRSHYNVYLKLGLVMLLWSGNSIVARALHEAVPPFTLALLRWTGAATILLPIAWRAVAADRIAIGRHWRVILLLGVVGVGSFNAFMYSGLQYTTAANSLLVQAAIPAQVLLLNYLLFRTAPLPAQIIGCIIAAAGVLVIVFRADPAALASFSFNRGDLLVLCGVVAWSLYTVLLRLRPAIQGASFLLVTFLIGALVMAPFAIHELQSRDIAITPTSLAGIGYVMIFPSVVSYFLYNDAVQKIGAGNAGQVINLQPLFGALLAALILGESLHPYHMAGMAMILLGIATSFLWARPR
jgi:drug/metabolite transporter (DMT)-like permease